jgi:hypothetical protein
MAKEALTRSPLARRLAIFAGLSAAAIAALSGCAGFNREQRAQWRNDAEATCMRSGRVKQTPYVKVAKSIDGPGVCGANYPIKVSALETAVSPDVAQNGNLILTSGNLMLTSITPTATLSCPMVSSTDEWLGQDVQAAAMTWFGQPVIELVTFGSFSCRPMNHRVGARLSEHSFANALDVKAFKFADGRTVSVASGWRGAPEEQGFLRETLHSACNRFTTVLGPGSDALHYDHFHLDLARHGSGNRRVCRPKVEMPAPPISGPNSYENRPMAETAPIYKPAGSMTPPASVAARGLPPGYPMPPASLSAQIPQRQIPRLSPGADIQQTGNPDAEVEEYSDERTFDGKYFDITSSVRSKDDPVIVRQRPGPPRRATASPRPPIYDPAGR